VTRPAKRPAAKAAPAVPFQAATRTLLRGTVMGAVNELVRSRGWSATTMADVATASGVSRQTLYNEFGSRSALVEVYIAREIQTLVERVSAAVRADAEDAHRALRHAFALFLQLASDEPVVQIIVADADTGELHQLLTGLGQRLAAATIAELIPEVWPQVGATDARMLSDTLVRLAISHALAPGDDPDRTADAVGRVLAPFIDELLKT
jgi:AcrR family transcriptional regulator